VKAGAASTTPWRAGTARQFGCGKRDGEVYECRNQWWNPLKTCDRLGIWWMAGMAVRCTSLQPGGTASVAVMPRPGATMKVCGVVVDRPAGEKLGTDPVDRSAVNVGTVFGSPSSRPAGSGAARHTVC
jgi:hypothetical protein